MKHEFVSRLALGLAICAFAAGCGRQSELYQNQSAELQSAMVTHVGADSALSDATFRDEVELVTNEITEAVATALLPSYTAHSVSSKAATAASCKPSFNFVMVGVGITFTPSAGCVLSGTVDVKLFPTSLNVNLTAVGLKFIDKVALQGTLVLGGSTDISLQFLNGHIDLNQVAGFQIGTLVFNGQAVISTATGFKVASRINAFAGASGLGVALLATVDQAAGVRTIQGCLLTDGNPQNPQSGATAPCFGI